MSTASFVYVLVNSAHSRLKIGKADDVQVRAAAFTRDAFDLDSSFALRTESARRARELETVLHLVFKRHRLPVNEVLADEGSSEGATEWFHIAALPALRRFVKQNDRLVGYTRVDSTTLVAAFDEPAKQNRPLRTPASRPPLPLYGLHELAFRTQYAELKERARALEVMLPGTPGTVREHSIRGHTYLYRFFYSVPGTNVEDFVARKDGLTLAALDELRGRVSFAQWMCQAAGDLRKLHFQVFDKHTARALVEWHNNKLLSKELVLAGSAAYRVWLNELGARVLPRGIALGGASEALTHLDVVAPLARLTAVAAPELKLKVHRNFRAEKYNTLELPGMQVLPVRVLVDGSEFGKTVRVPSHKWHAVTLAHANYLTADLVDAAALAGGHCVPLQVPSAERLVWHMLYASTTPSCTTQERARAIFQAATLAAVLVEQNDADLGIAWAAAPRDMRDAVLEVRPALRDALGAHPQTLEHLEAVLAGGQQGSRLRASTG